MNKSKESMNKIVKFLREIAVIVIGVAITLFASYLITKSGEKRDMHLYLNAIKMELEENIKILEEKAVLFEHSVKYADYLRSNKKELLNADSISNYVNVYYQTPTNTFRNNAFEMFKTSGSMRLLKDKELLLGMWDVYTLLTDIKIVLDKAQEFKLNEVMKEIGWSDTERQKNVPMYFFYRSEAPYMMLYQCKNGVMEVKGFLLELDKVLKY